MEEPRWNLDELAERVDAALAVDYRGQSSGRVRDVPDRRAIRWYTTIGLIVAVKRLQAEGLPLVAIQQELAGATNSQLARVARLPEGADPMRYPDSLPVAAAPHRGGVRGTGGVAGATGRFAPRRATPEPPAVRAYMAEDESPAAGAPPGAAASQGVGGAEGAGGPRAERELPAPGASQAGHASRAVRGGARRASFWRQQPVAAFAEVENPGAESSVATAARAASGEPAVVESRAPATAKVAPLQGVRLGEGATLLLEPGRQLDAADVRDLLAAAGPLLAVIRDRGLGRPERRRTSGNEPRREHP
jgi:hypothetical protein